MRTVWKEILNAMEDVKKEIDRVGFEIGGAIPVVQRYVVLTVWDRLEAELGLNYSNFWGVYRTSWIGNLK